ncbi:Pex19-domain-containing protein [Lentithecium fluviatile CBS 122367]|uniref:Pex19-domain-containing protein n=1 Tax=Lentithecium fluviatile CBS 122367 TaxID=1168545 RepID=A0A6G1JNP4_9PLEO|nr:Pex19-domain-containing protein [Lentithecium fluviatile CBS 122367]
MADTEKKKEEPTKPGAEIASDPEEDDLSDLDDVLDEFANTKLDSKAPVDASSSSAPAPASSGPGRPDPADLLVDDQDEFAKQLQKEMEQLLGQDDFQKQFEDIMKEMGDAVGVDPSAVPKDGAAPPAAAASSSTDTKSAETTQKAEQTFQESIRATMARMQESGDAASAAAATSSGDDILAQMLKEMESGGFGGEGSDEDFSKVLMGMMEQLTNKDILYEPMKELHDKFPTWMEQNRTKVKEDDLKRYEEQHLLVREIVGRFERKGYSDSNAGDREYIVERMQKMQAAGSPPPDLVGDMNAAQEAMQEMDQGCPTQ